MTALATAPRTPNRRVDATRLLQVAEARRVVEAAGARAEEMVAEVRLAQQAEAGAERAGREAGEVETPSLVTTPGTSTATHTAMRLCTEARTRPPPLAAPRSTGGQAVRISFKDNRHCRVEITRGTWGTAGPTLILP